MHEWGIAQGIIDKIKTAARDNSIEKVSRAQIKLGRKLGISRDEFLFCLKSVSQKDELLEGCDFRVEEIDSKLASLEAIETDQP